MMLQQKALGALLATFVLAAVAGAAQAASETDDVIAYGCGDVVVIGRLHGQTYAPIEDETDLLGHGIVTADIRITNVLHGRPEGDEVRVGFIAHALYVENRDFVFVLSPEGENRYGLVRAQLAQGAGPELAPRCE